MTCPILNELENGEALVDAAVPPEEAEAEAAVAVPGAARLLVPPRLNLPWVVGSVEAAAVEAVPDVDMVLVEPNATGVKLFDEPKDELFI